MNPVDTVLVFEGQGAKEIPGDPPVDLFALAPVDAQTAIVRHQLARARSWLSDPDRSDVGVLGQSLGELTALVVAGAVDEDDALTLVRLRAELPAALLEPRDWTMASLTRVAPADAEAAAEDLALWVIGWNGPADCIVVGETEAFEALKPRVRLRPSTYRTLPVVHPYHTPLMQPVADEMAETLAGMDVRDPTLPVLSPTGPRAVTTADEARAVVVEALVSPVSWTATLAFAVARWAPTRWRECGPSASLYRFAWKNGLDTDWGEA